jgi:hypothetical protein
VEIQMDTLKEQNTIELKKWMKKRKILEDYTTLPEELNKLQSGYNSSTTHGIIYFCQ